MYTTTGSPNVPSLAAVCDKPNQPSDESLYPVQDTGLLRQDGAPKLRFVNLNWYKQCAWLHWDTQSQKMFCFHCLRERQRAMFILHRKLYQPEFIDSGRILRLAKMQFGHSRDMKSVTATAKLLLACSQYPELV